MWLDPESGWGTTTGSITSHVKPQVVSVAKYEHYLMGGSTGRYGKKVK